jgi:thiamine biosynthesis lipoprotein
MTAPAETVRGRTFPALGTFAAILVTVPAALDAAGTALAAELCAIDLACSRFRPDSELTRVNQAAGQPVGVSQLFTDALAAALAAARLTDGDVDPTCGRSLAELGYDRDFALARRHTGPVSQPARPAPGWQVVELDPGQRTVRLPAGAMLDLGATAKALAADRAAARIAATLDCGVLVNLGGDISVAGDPPPGGWRVGIADDADFGGIADEVPPGQAVCISDGGLATSSTLVRGWRRGEEDLHHIIAPRTGLPARSCWRTVSVAAATCLDANTASTAAIIRGEQAVGWLTGLRLPARFVRHDGSVTVAGGWPPDSPAPPTATRTGVRA